MCIWSLVVVSFTLSSLKDQGCIACIYHGSNTNWSLFSFCKFEGWIKKKKCFEKEWFHKIIRPQPEFASIFMYLHEFLCKWISLIYNKGTVSVKNVFLLHFLLFHWFMVLIYQLPFHCPDIPISLTTDTSRVWTLIFIARSKLDVT